MAHVNENKTGTIREQAREDRLRFIWIEFAAVLGCFLALKREPRFNELKEYDFIRMLGGIEIMFRLSGRTSLYRSFAGQSPEKS